MTDAYIREGIALANSAREQADRIRRAREYSASCEREINWEAVGGIIAIITIIVSFGAIFAHLL